MTGLFGKIRHHHASGKNVQSSAPVKEPVARELLPIQETLLDAGPLRKDGSDKYFGMENAQFCNTCYCNSILQCLYFSVPFREFVINYPKRSLPDLPHDSLPNYLRFPDPNVPLEELLKPKPQPQINGKALITAPPQKPDEKDSQEYRKKVALHTLPILETSDNSESYGMKESLFTSLKDMFEAIVASPERVGVIRPYHFMEVLRRENEMFRTNVHQDAHEFLNLLLNAVVSNVEAHAAQLSDSDRSEGASERTVTTNSSNSKSNTRWVHELFEGTLTSETQCLTCENISQRDEVFLDLSVDLEKHSSVTACLRKFSEEEVLCERNKFHCDNCGALQEAEKRMKIKRLPKILALHLKRFKYSEDSDRLQKLFHRVVYPYHLRLTNTTDDAEDPDRLYELYAVVVHIGGGPYHGHYVSIIKTEDRGWFLFDDESVQAVEKDYVRGFFGDRSGLGSAYVLFYQEISPEAMARQLAKENSVPPKDFPSKEKEKEKETTSSFSKANGHAVSPPKNIDRVRSAIDPPAIDTNVTPVKHIPSAPQLPLRNSGDAGRPSLSGLQPIKSPTSFVGSLRLKREKTKSERERKSVDEKSQKERDKKQESGYDIPAKANGKIASANVERRNTASNEKESSGKFGLNRLKLGGRSFSQSRLFHKDKDNVNGMQDVPHLPPMSASLGSSNDVFLSDTSTDDVSTNATTTTSGRPPSPRTPTAPTVPLIDTHGVKKQPTPKRSIFALRKKSFV